MGEREIADLNRPRVKAGRGVKSGISESPSWCGYMWRMCNIIALLMKILKIVPFIGSRDGCRAVPKGRARS